MASKELIEKVAEAIGKCGYQNEPAVRVHSVIAKVAISTILAALKKPTPAMKYAAALYTNGSHDLAHAAINAAINASPLGEQSE